MQTKRAIAAFAIGFASLMLFAEASAFNLNKSIRVEAGSESDGESTVNGSITVGSDAVVNGSLETVNGTIRIDDNARVGDVETVNGAIRLASGVTAGKVGSVNGSVSLDAKGTVDSVSVVNGRISLEEGSSVDGDVENVNGEFDIRGASIGGDLTTVNGDVTLVDNAVLRGDLTVEEPNFFGRNGRQRQPKIVVGPGVRIEGTIVLEREVELYISDSAEVGGVSGVMGMEDAVRFSGDRP